MSGEVGPVVAAINSLRAAGGFELVGIADHNVGHVISNKQGWTDHNMLGAGVVCVSHVTALAP